MVVLLLAVTAIVNSHTQGDEKTNTEEHNNLISKCEVVAAIKENAQRCPVRIYEKYMSLRPSGCDAFYVRALKCPKPDTWYYSVAVGRHTLSRVVRRLCEMAGFEGFFMNHSLRATTATRLYESGIEKKLVAERTGHRSSAIREYKRASDHALKVVDDVVQGKRPATPATSTVTTSSSNEEATCPASPVPQTPQTISFTVERKETNISFKM